MDIVLIAGLWLRSAAWDATARDLRALGHRTHIVALPGVDDATEGATLEDQLHAVVRTIDAAERPLVVGHSAASTLAHLAADRRGGDVAGTVLLGGFPTTGGKQYAPFFPLVDGAMPFPGLEPFEGADAADLDTAHRAAFAEQAVPVPGGVSTGIVEYTSPRRAEVPTWLLCPEYSPEDARAWIEAGDVPELSAATHLFYADIDSGHWPMLSCPERLARALSEIASEAGTFALEHGYEHRHGIELGEDPDDERGNENGR